MKMRGLRRKKKNGEDAVATTSLNTQNNSSSANTLSFSLHKKGFRRRIPPQIVVTSPLKRLLANSSNDSRALSALTTEDETISESEVVFVTPEKVPAGSLLAVPGTTVDSSLLSLEELGLVDSVMEWLDSVGSLVQSPEMQRFLHTSGHLVLSAGGVAVQTACFPVTFPWHVASETTRFIVGRCVMPLLGVTQFLWLQPNEPHPSTASPPRQSAREDRDCDNDEPHDDNNPLSMVVRGVWGFPGHVWGMAHHVKDEVGGIVLRTLAPPLHGTIQESCRPGESTAETPHRDNVLERLRLDYTSEPVDLKQAIQSSPFLLRVDDLGIRQENGTLHYVDLNSLHDSTVLQALDRLVHIGLCLIANHPTVRLTHQAYVPPRDQEIEWKPEGNTPKLLRRLSKLDVLARLDVLCTETLVWSGRFLHDMHCEYDRQSRFFLARGVLHMSPRALLDLLWDNARTADYNKFCLGRATLAGNDLEFLNGPDKVGTKVIQSETRVPLTSISVTVKCLMHARALPDNAGYVIVSRSCATGPAGTHYTPLHHVSRPKNEIHWGVNIIRRVPNREDMVDLTSHSQVGTAGVPQFLAAKIALMGVEGFFENARKLACP